MANGIQNWAWQDYEGDFNQDILYNTQRRAGDTAGALLDFNSPFYQQYASYLNKAIPGVGTNDFLPTLVSGGGNYGGSMAQALALKGNATRKRQDLINTGVGAFASQNVGTAANLLGTQGQIGSNILQGQLTREQMEQEKGGWLDSLGTIVGTVGGFALAGPLGGMLGGSLGSLFGGGGMASGASSGGGMARRAR